MYLYIWIALPSQYKIFITMKLRWQSESKIQISAHRSNLIDKDQKYASRLILVTFISTQNKLSQDYSLQVQIALHFA